MPHYKTMFDAGANADYLFAADLDGREITVEIEHVSVGELTGENNRKTRKPALRFKGKRKRLAINKTNGKAIAKLYGTNTDGWIGKRITIYPTTTTFGGETVECIRVRPKAPDGEKTVPPERQRPVPPSEFGKPQTSMEEDALYEGMPEAELARQHREDREQMLAGMTADEVAEIERLEREEAERG